MKFFAVMLFAVVALMCIAPHGVVGGFKPFLPPQRNGGAHQQGNGRGTGSGSGAGARLQGNERGAGAGSSLGGGAGSRLQGNGRGASSGSGAGAGGRQQENHEE